MPLALPAVPGVSHADIALPTGVTVHVAEAGAAGAPPVLLLHGWPQHWYEWRDVIPRLAGGFRLLAPDFRGFGWSGQPADGDFAKARLVDDVLALLDLRGIERASVAGHDWGGWVAFLLAERAPERVERVLGLNILPPWTTFSARPWSAWRLGYQPVLAAPGLGPRLIRGGRLVRRVLRAGWQDHSRWDEAAAESFVDVVREPAPAEASSRLYRTFLLREVPTLERGRRPPDVRMRMVFGERDRFLDHRLVEGIELELVPDAGHFIVDERPELVAERIGAFFG